jgi:hypothetical protein
VLLVAPILLHCVAIAAGKVDALVGYGPATAAATWRSAWVAAAGASATSAASALTSADVAAAAAAVQQQQQPVNLHKLVVRGAAGYMFVAALLGQAVHWLAVVAAVALLMLAGRQAVEGWQRLHAAACAAGWKQQQAAGGAGARNAHRHAKQKGT